MFRLLAKYWDPIMGHCGTDEVDVTTEPLVTHEEAESIYREFKNLVEPNYRGQGSAMLSLRIVEVK